MKLSNQVVLTAVGLLILSAGVLAPLGGSIREARNNVQALRQSTGPVVSAQSEIELLMQRIDEQERGLSERPVKLCPRTPEAASACESAVADEVRTAGLRRLSMDRGPGAPIGGLDDFVIDLAVEGSASQLHALLLGLEGLPWINRVLHVEVHKGESLRRIDLRIAVLLEDQP